MKVRLIREVTSPAASGPFQGQYALQRALRRYGPAWLYVGGRLAEGEVPWFWCWQDAPAACRCAAEGRPLILGPNVLFHNSRRPGQLPYERFLCRAASCRLLFTESAWYRELIARHLGPANRAPIAVWPYPVEWPPGYPTDPSDPTDRSDLLIYAKSGFTPGLLAELARRFPRSEVVRYGHYRRAQLLAAARRSRACVYLSDDDRGPLALAEILLCGCPAVGVATGAPWIEPGVNGALVAALEPDCLAEAVAVALGTDRAAVAAAARVRFAAETVVGQIVRAVENHVFE